MSETLPSQSSLDISSLDCRCIPTTVLVASDNFLRRVVFYLRLRDRSHQPNRCRRARNEGNNNDGVFSSLRMRRNRDSHPDIGTKMEKNENKISELREGERENLNWKKKKKNWDFCNR